ncbi:hypothetical protein EON81_02850 [bacterium]|nr:MAG: hypothetical protein EON81_02850 [bacterium]
MPESSHIGWPRWWQERGEIPDFPSLFLLDPTVERSYFPNKAKQLSDIVGARVLLLVGEPGSGKSTTLEAYAESLGRKVVVARAIGNHQDIVGFLDSEADGLVMVDGLDESPFLSIGDGLARWAYSHLDRQLCLTCRPGILSDVEEAFLRMGLKPEVWRLAPLRETDIDTVAKAYRIDAEAFRIEIIRVGAEAFAAQASRLIAMAQLFKAERGRLRENQWAMYEAELFNLCREKSNAIGHPSMQSRLSEKTALDVLSRIAAATILCGRQGVWIRQTDDSPKDFLRISDLSDANGDPNKWDAANADEPEIFRALHLGRFTSHRHGEMTWEHRGAAEFLTARYLMLRNVPLPQLVQLFTEQGRVIKPLQGTATFLASKHGPFFEHLLGEDPELLLEIDPQALTPERRLKIATRLFESIRDRTIQKNVLYSFYSLRSLSAEGLADLVREHLTADTGEANPCLLAIQMARACGIVELAEAIANLALDKSADLEVRIGAMRAVRDIGLPNPEILKPLLTEIPPGDVDSDLKGHVLHVLWPNHLSVEELLEVLTVPTGVTHRGYYRAFFYEHLFEEAPVESLAPLIEWAVEILDSTNTHDSENWVEKALLISYRHIANPEILAAFIRLLLQAEEALHTHAYPWLKDNSLHFEGKVMIGLKLLDSEGEDWRKSWVLVHRHPLFDAEDVPMLLDIALQAEADDPIFKLVDTVVGDETGWQLMAERLGSSAAFDQRYHHVLTVLAHRKEMKRRGKEKENQQREALALRRHENARRIRERLLGVLFRFAHGTISSFGEMLDVLRIDPDTAVYTQSTSDIEKLQGWPEADGSLQSQILQACTAFVALDPASIERGSAEWQAVYPALRFVTQRSGRFDEDLVRKWAEPIVDYAPEVAESIDLELWDTAFHADPQRAAVQIERRVSESAHGYPYYVDSPIFRERSAQPIGDIFLKAILKNVGISIEGYVYTAINQGSTVAFSLLRDELGRGDSKRDAVILYLLISEGSKEDVQFAYDRLTENPRLSRHLLRHLSFSDRPSRLTARYGISLLLFEALYRRLAKRFPESADLRPRGWRRVKLKEQLQSLRDKLLNAIVQSGLPESRDSIHRLQRELPENDWLREVELMTESAISNAQWIWPTPDKLRVLLQDPIKAFIRSDRDLQEAVLASLKRLDLHLKSTGMTWIFWNEHSDRPPTVKYEDRISDFVRDWLKRDLESHGIFVNREVVPRPSDRCDIFVQSSTDTVSANVVIEAKRSGNSEVLTAIETQLAGRYLEDAEASYGIYLVYLHDRSARSQRLEELEAMATTLSNANHNVRPFVLDISLPA